MSNLSTFRHSFTLGQVVANRLLVKCQTANPVKTQYFIRNASHKTRSSLPTITNVVASERRFNVFQEEKERQRRLITDIKKIKVEYHDHPEPCTLYMNKDLSTPFDCAKHVSKLIGERAVLADVDGQFWDMHRPLQSDVECLKLLHTREADPYHVNKAFWRSCSLMLGAVIETCFKKKHYAQLCSFPPPNVRSGSFVYDVDIGMDWKPSNDELRVLSGEMVKLSMKQLPFERLTVPLPVAMDMFKDNVYKTAQIPHIASSSKNGDVTLYRIGSFIDISRGPMMANTSQLGRVSITAVHRLPLPEGSGGPTLLRVQGVALPSDILMNHYSFNILEERSKKLNEGRFPDMSAAEEV